MPSNFTKDDPIFGTIDLDDAYITDAWLVDQFVGNQLITFGTNTSGRLGLSDITNRSSPVQVGLLVNWKQVACGDTHTCCTKNDGTLWSWGNNDFSQLGLSDTLVSRSSPVQVGSLTNWKQVACGVNYNACIKTDGTLWTWGLNSFGNLGLGDATGRSSPVQVGTLTNWKDPAGGQRSTLCVKTDGTLWAWGGNGDGQLGLSDTTNRSSPVQVGTLTDWKQPACGPFASACVKTDGTLWTWGFNQEGQLGLQDVASRSSPVQVGSLTNWKQVASGYPAGGSGSLNAHVMCIKTDGTLWAWGSNGNGQLGLNDRTNRSSPVQVGSLTNWKMVMCGAAHTVCIKTDGTLWAWGNNGGRLGLGELLPRSSPVQVGSLTNWKQAAGGTLHSACVTFTDII